MLQYLWLIPAFPFAGFVILALVGGRLPRTLAALIGAGSVGCSAMLSLLVALEFLALPAPGPAQHLHYSQTLAVWFRVGAFAPSISLYLDALSLVMILVITFVAFLIHLYSAEFMEREEGFSRFFAYLNLFVGMMLTLVLGGNLLVLYFGWEGVGLCSYLLIGFWYKDPANGRAARKAFVVTRAGDTSLAIGLFLLVRNLGTLEIQPMLASAAAHWPVGSSLAVAAAALLLGGALGKSAQLPLQVWLPDAMAGPTPVSALIHAATMVTAGVYLIARTNVLFTLAPVVEHAVALIGALTLLLAGLSALTQRDLKRCLAYSTISQIGYMFLALGVGAWPAAMFHFMTHAFFKALLFLAAGVVILAQHHEHDMFKMGGLRRELPVTFICFLFGAASLASLPLITAGFYSKDAILWEVWTAPGRGAIWLWLAGFVGAFITALYSFRMVFLVFYGPRQLKVTYRPGGAMLFPLVILAALSLAAGFIDLPRTLGDRPLFSHFISTALPMSRPERGSLFAEAVLQLDTALAGLAGVYLAYFFYLRRPGLLATHLRGNLAALRDLAFAGWGFDGVYRIIIVRPFVWLTRANRGDVIDRVYDFAAWIGEGFHVILSATQTGRVRWYALALACGAALTLAIMVFT